MLRTLLTPLRLRFDSSPRSAVTTVNVTTPSIPDEEELDPEDFARDVLIELMRLSLDKLKVAGNTHDRMEVLAEIQRITMQDTPGATKDVFREMDGFLSIMSALAAAYDRPMDEKQVAETIECSRLAFMITSEAINDHAENAQYFRKRVGYEALATAIAALVSDPRTVDYTMGLLLSFAFRNFSLAGAFTSIRTAAAADLDATLLEIVSRLGGIKRPGAMAVLCRLAPQLTGESTTMRYGVRAARGHDHTLIDTAYLNSMHSLTVCRLA